MRNADKPGFDAQTRGESIFMAARSHDCLDVQRNLILGSLDSDVFQRLAPRLEKMPLTRGEIVCSPDSKLSHAYFPISGIISLSHLLENGSTVESAMIGNEGMLGVSLFAGGYTMLTEASVQIDGQAYRLPAEALMTEFNRSASMRNRLMRYTLALFAQTSQTAICNSQHSLQQRLCRRLLLALDRLPGNQVHLTQEQIAGSLGVRREGVCEAAGQLQQAGLITSKRGKITILDKKGLTERSCECYQVVKEGCVRLEKIEPPRRKHFPYSVERRREPRPAPPAGTA